VRVSWNEIVFGPVPSRRLGRSLGINNVFMKYCSYSCIYCQAGKTTNLTIERTTFYEPEILVDAVIRALENVGNVDYVTFVPNGEPTLDANLGTEIGVLKDTVDAKVAVITNASLLYRRDVRRDLSSADLVSVKVDSSTESVYRVLNRPHPQLSLRTVLNGLRVFSREFQGDLITETMLVRGVNDTVEDATGLLEILRSIEPRTAYVMLPVRPPAESWVSPPPADAVEAFLDVLRSGLGRNRVVLLGHLEPPHDIPRSAGNLDSILSHIRSVVHVHPLKLEYAVRLLMANAGVTEEDALRILLNDPLLELIYYMGQRFLRLRSLQQR